MPEVNIDITPTGFLGHDGSAPGLMTVPEARSLLALSTADLSDTGELATADYVDLYRSGAGAPTFSARFVGDIYINTTPNPDTVYQALGPSIGSGAADWSLLSDLALAANEVAAMNSAGTALEARGQKGSFTFDIVDPAGDGEWGAWRAPWAGTLDTVKHKSRGGTTTTVQVKKNGSNMTGFSSGVATSTSEGSVTVGDSFAAGDYITNKLATVSGLSADGDGRKGVRVTFNITRTGA